jgi:hypothetical protein
MNSETKCIADLESVIEVSKMGCVEPNAKCYYHTTQEVESPITIKRTTHGRTDEGILWT